MKILVTGASGLVGSRFVELYSNPQDLLTPGIDEFDLSNPKEYLSIHKPDIVLNFAAFTDVSTAEKQRGDKASSCWQVNVEGIRNLLGAFSANSRLIHISTDMVFSGSSGSYRESDIPETDHSKVTWYGFTKAEAERIIGDRGTIVRIIYPVRASYGQKLDYLKKPLSLHDQGKLYPLFVDQQINITYIDEFCIALQKIINGNLSGVYHVASRDLTTPHELISYYISRAKNIIFSAVVGNIDPTRYPKYGGLDSTITQEKLGIKFSSWKEIVEKLLSTS